MILFRLLGAVASIAIATAVVASEPYLLSETDLAALALKAPAALRAPLLTVVDKPQASPSGDAHDYVSYARYYWPDPTRPDGLPFVSRDGHHNEEQVARGDHRRLWNFSGNVGALAAAWRRNRDEAAARRAVEWLRAWFITPGTRMNPSLDFAQVRLGHRNNRGNPAGLIDARCFSQVIDALLLLHDSPALSPPDEAAIQAWFTRYLEWLTTAPNATAERAAKNNHGSWYLAQVIPIARYVGRGDLARQLCEEDRARIAGQINPDGRQPEEIRRVDGLSYSAFNLDAQFQVARQAAGLGIDLWNYVAPDGASLRVALEYLRPFNHQPETWPTAQNATVRAGFLDDLLEQARVAMSGDSPSDGK